VAMRVVDSHRDERRVPVVLDLAKAKGEEFVWRSTGGCRLEPFPNIRCVFHTKLDSDFAPSWTGISREGGHGFHGKLDSDFTRSWTVAA
jgi:hypothetical protein